MAENGRIRLDHVLDNLSATTQKARNQGLIDLQEIFKYQRSESNIDILSDKSYHKIFESLFKAAITEKHALSSAAKTTKTSIIGRLSLCGEVVRQITAAAGLTLKGKTVEAIIEHISQTLPEADGTYCEPLMQNYLRTLIALFEHQHIVENLKNDVWLDAVDFCLQAISYHLDSHSGEPSTLSHSSSGLGTRQLSGSLIKFNASNGGGKNPPLSYSNIEDLFQVLLFLVSSSRALLPERYAEISDTTLRFLQAQGYAVGQVHQLAFSTLNAVMRYTRIDRYSYSQKVARDVIPIICGIWRGKSLTKDLMLNSVRDEILVLVLSVHLHLERCILDDETGDVLSLLEELADSFRTDYAKRKEEEMLLLDQLNMADFGGDPINTSPFRLYAFSLMSHNSRSERLWAILQAIGVLERFVALGRQQGSAASKDEEDEEGKHPRKRQRIAQNMDRILDSVRDENEQMRTAGLQWIPFVLEEYQLSSLELRELLAHLTHCAADKRGKISSWALLALASCTNQEAITGLGSSEWIQLWHAGTRALTFSATARPAALLLHALIVKDLVHYHDIGEDVNSIISAFDTNGPVILCDSSIFLMSHLLHARVSEAPGASLAASQNVIRWLFARWNPVDREYAAHYAAHVQPLHLMDLLRTCLGLPRSKIPLASTMPCEAAGQGWQHHLDTQDIVRYVLLLTDSKSTHSPSSCSSCPPRSKSSNVVLLNNASFSAARKLILELTHPKCTEILSTWKRYVSGRSGAVSTDTFRSGIYSCVAMSLLMPYFTDANPAQVQILENELPDLAGQLLQFLDDAALRDSREAHKLNETLLQSLGPYLPTCDTAEFHLLSQSRHLLRFLVSVADDLTRRNLLPAELSSQAGLDKMDVDPKSPKREDDVPIARQKTVMPRRDLALDTWPGSFYQVAIGRLAMVAASNITPDLVGFVPSAFVDYFLGLSIEDILSSRRLLQEIILSDLTLIDADAGRILEHLAEMLSSKEFWRCEVALQTCLEVMAGTWPLWSNPNGSDASEAAAQIYEWFIGTALENDLASPGVQKSIARLLLLLLRKNREYGVIKGLTSPRSSLLSLLKKSNASVKFYIGERLPQIFNLFILKDHDQVFVDIQNTLPADPDWLEGIFFRLFVFAKLASNWPNLLRRCIYHIFETAGKLSECIDHASRCLIDIARDLKVDGPGELFALFAPQVLYTWLEYENIEGIPFRVFGFSSLRELIEHAPEEATALMVMRGQDIAVDRLAAVLEIDTGELLRLSFTKVMAYTVAHDTSTPPSNSNKTLTGEARVKKRLGKDAFFECVHVHFADIIAVLFNLIERESEVEKYFLREEISQDAAKVMKEIKAMSFSDAILPANQQPTFRARYLIAEIQHLCSRTQYEIKSLYTPALVISTARQLLNTIHPALGSLHACSVIRKLRVLISLAGDSVTSGYPLEMILQSVRPFITDTECADDAIGIMQYLISVGSVYLLQTPSFIAGISVAVLGSLRVFLESHKASTTQESQHKMTMTKAQKFHAWMGEYLSNYSSPWLSSQLKPKFQALIKYAFNLRSIGNADVGTPESKLLVQLLEDEKAGGSLLSRPARKLALQMLSSDFRAPSTFRADALGIDDLSISYAEVVWRSCQGSDSKEYLSWAAKVLGRAFASSGHMHEELLRESTLFQARELSTSSGEVGNSATCVLKLLHELILGYDARTVGLAEIALRDIMSNSDDALAIISQRSIPDSLQHASMWQPYQIPPSEQLSRTKAADLQKAVLSTDAIFQEHWLRDLSVIIAQSVPNDPVLGALVPILRKVSGFAERAFPFILHLVLSASPNEQQISKQKISTAFVGWFAESDAVERNNLRMLLNSILYLRTQPLSGEKSSADRARWLDVDYLRAAAAATRCGMFKTSLLLVEEYCSQPTKSSRRSSAINTSEQADIPTELLLAIFENVDDPDMYYGVQQSPNLNTILARFEYEKDGPKSLAFRGAQYDSHIRRHDPESTQDVQSLVRALNVLNQNGLSHSLLQAQQTIGMTPKSLESMFQTARKLEQWDIPVPTTCTNNAVTIYKAFQAVDTADSKTPIIQAVNEGLEYTMRSLAREDLSVSALHGSLQTLAALVEIDEVLTSGGSEQFEEMLSRFRGRSGWMKVGQFEDVSQILSCRATTLSTLSQRPRLQHLLQIQPIDTRFVELHTALLASTIHRAHSALQESLSLATGMIDLIKPCHEVGIHSEVAIYVEAANSLWDQGEMASSIGMLQGLDNRALLKDQTIPVGRSDLLSKIGHQVSIARLEKADKIIEKYLKPALKELNGKTQGSEASQVFHQFAIFCDQQLQDPDSLEDLERLTKLRKNKATEVLEYDKLIRTASSSTDRNKYKNLQLKAKTWLKLDEEELERHSRSRDEFLRQCLENYLLALAASDDYDGITLRFSALWLQNSEDQLANDAVAKHLNNVPSRKFAPLMNQLSSRLQNLDADFQKLLFSLVLRICKDHPLHGMYQIYAGTMSRINDKDESAVSRREATKKISQSLAGIEVTGQMWTAVHAMNKNYCSLAAEKDEQKYRAGKKVSLKESRAASHLNQAMSRYKVPPPTMQIPLLADCNYSQLPVMQRLDSHFSIASGVSAPKIITVVASNGVRFKQLVKGGNDDLRQDAIMEQVFEQVSGLLKINRSTRQRNLSIRTYRVLPLTNNAGVIEFVANTMPLHDYLMPAHQRYYPKDLKGSQCREEISNVQTKSVEVRVQKFRQVTEKFHPVMRYFFTERFSDPDEWFVKRLAYSRSTAAISILGHVLGLGDRHGHNILLDSKSGEIVHIDLGVAFEMGRVLPVPELVPFRLTRDIVDGMGITKTEGVFRRCCEFTLEALRKEVYSIMTILDVLRYDPLYSWSISPIRLARLQQGQSAALEAAEVGNATERTKEAVNEPGEADRALTVVNKKLSKTLSVTATVNDLINQASDERNLAVLFSGWAAYA